jgi:hypothetical protein
VQRPIRHRIDGGVQPLSLGIESNHGLVDRNVIRVSTVRRPYVGLLDPPVGGGSTTVDTRLSRAETVSESERPVR